MSDFIDKRIEAMIPKGRKVTPEVFKHYEERFFSKAHEHFYGCTPDMRIEIAQYHRGVISSTMMRYVQHLLREEENESEACKASLGDCSGACMYCLQQAN